jgi:hypothetical protein
MLEIAAGLLQPGEVDAILERRLTPLTGVAAAAPEASAKTDHSAGCCFHS